MAELDSYVDGKELTSEALEAICCVFEYPEQKKYDSLIHTMLKQNKVSVNEPKHYENIASLSALYAKNIAFIGLQGAGKPHLTMVLGLECCLKGY